MTNCHDLFEKFHAKIELSEIKKDNLRISRGSIRKRIKKHFLEVRKDSAPKFKGQGSYRMGTIVNPLPNEEYDIDDGVYLQNLPLEKKDWPATETVHKWISEAVKDKTEADPIDKAACVRVVYANDYHVDLPAYGIYQDIAYLAVKGEKQWVMSEPIKLANWFNAKVDNKGNQLRKVVRYLKAWADKQNRKMPNGLILSVLSCDHYKIDQREDIAFSQMVEGIYSAVKDSFVVINPINVAERLTDRLSSEQKDNFSEAIKRLAENSRKALELNSKRDASKIWQKEFGDRFPIVEDGIETINSRKVTIVCPVRPHCED